MWCMCPCTCRCMVLYITVYVHRCMVLYITVYVHRCMVLYITVYVHRCMVLYITVYVHRCMVLYTCSQVYASLHPRSSGYYQLAPTGRPAYCDFHLTSAWQPATSCNHIFSLHPSTPSGYYWVQGQGDRPVEVFCDMGRRCCGQEGGWARVAHLDMTDPAQHCPRNFRRISAPTGSGRPCTREQSRDLSLPVVSGCSSMLIQTSGLQYSRVCGRVIAYQHDAPDAFVSYSGNRSLTLNDPYVDGVSITHGQPRQHIWTFAGATDETSANAGRCPCSKTGQTLTAVIPPYVGNDYFCDSGSRSAPQNRYYQDDPLWDGQGCGPTSTCCTFNNPPWFCKTLPQPASDDIELRLCAAFVPQAYNEDTPIELVEIFVQ